MSRKTTNPQEKNINKQLSNFLGDEFDVTLLTEETKTEVIPEQKASALDAGGLDLEDVGAKLMWIDAKKLEDNPFQTRLSYNEYEMDEHIADVAESLNRVGQLQPGIARPHPDKRKASAGWFQVGVGHCRTRAVLEGGNAGSNLPDPKRFVGKVLMLVKPLNNIEMQVLVIEENEARKNPNAIERAHGLINLQKMLLESGAEAKTWRAYAESKGITYERLRQLARLLELPKQWRKNIASNLWNEKHGRALLSLKDKAADNSEPVFYETIEEVPERMQLLARQIEREGLSGNAAVNRAMRIRQTHPTEKDAKILDVAASEIKQGSRRRAATAQEIKGKGGTQTQLSLVHGGALAIVPPQSTNSAPAATSEKAFDINATSSAISSEVESLNNDFKAAHNVDPVASVDSMIQQLELLNSRVTQSPPQIDDLARLQTKLEILETISKTFSDNLKRNFEIALDKFEG